MTSRTKVSSWFRRWVPRLAALAGGYYIVRIIASDLSDLRQVEFELPPLLGAIALLSASWVISGLAWVALFNQDLDLRLLAHAYAIGQVAKYVPGGILQAIGQITATNRIEGVSGRGAAAAYALSTAAAVEGAFIVSAFGVLIFEDAPWLWLSIPAVLLGALVLHPAIVSRIALRLPDRFQIDPGEIPGSRQLLVSVCLYIGSLITSGLGFVLVAGSIGSDIGWSSAFVFAPAWVLGVLALPVPAGIGIREGVIAALISGTPAGILIAASLAHRVITLATEVGFVAASTGWASVQRSLQARLN